MNAVRPGRSIPLLLVLLSCTAFATQEQTPAPPPQTARQALVEMLTKGPEAVTKHLTVDVQEFLKQPENRQAKMTVGSFISLNSPSGDLETFESGPVLLAISEPNRHQKTEFRVEEDEPNGDQDTFQLSLHVLRDGQEQHETWSSLLSHFTVTMIRQQGIWRLSNLGMGIEVPLGEPEFLKGLDATFNHGNGVAVVAGGVAGPRTHETSNLSVQPTEMPPQLIVLLLGGEEAEYARQHAEQGFTCSLSDLAKGTENSGIDPEIWTGSYKGYRISLNGCEGKPAASFQLTVEPVSPAPGTKAHCVDATQNVRYSEDGRGATCLSAGVTENTAEEE